MEQQSEPEKQPTDETEKKLIDLKIHPKRLVSLDAFRGLTILGMLLVNNVALNKFTPKHLTHAAWNAGVNFADLIFPWFLFIVGVALPFAVSSYRKKNIPVWRYDLKVLGRAITLIFLGCLIDSSLAKTPLFDLGVLQLIALAYFVGAMLYELPIERRIVIAAGFLIAHWAAIKYLPIPGIGAGIFTEDTNIIKHLNTTYLQPYHLNGIISVVPTSALVLIGTMIGDILHKDNISQLKRCGMLMATGAGLSILGWLWNLNLSFNKPVWTPSYILYTAGLATITFCIFYFIIDVKNLKTWALPFVVFGVNAIMAYFVPIIIKIHVLQEWNLKIADGSTLSLQLTMLHYCIVNFGTYWGGWLYTTGYIVFWWIILFVMYKKKIFLKV